MMSDSRYTTSMAFHSMTDMTSVTAKVTRNGQVSLPAELRRRWRAGSVLVVDRGDYAIVRPIPDDVIATLQGAHAGPGPSSEQARVAERESEVEVRSSKRRTR